MLWRNSPIKLGDVRDLLDDGLVLAVLDHALFLLDDNAGPLLRGRQVES